MSIPPLFVIGCPRSGTTLLASLLRQTATGGGAESHFIPKYARKLASYGDLGERANRAQLLRDILKERPVAQWRLDIDPDRFVEAPETADFGVLVDRLFRERSGRRGFPSWADKTPHYVFEVELLDRLFPGCRFIHVVRDGRDVALSLLRKSWGPKNVYACAKLWKECVAGSPALDRVRAEGRVLDVHYEQLVREPVETTRQAYGFLEHPFDAIRLDTVLRSVMRDNFGKWKLRLTAAEIEIFESVAADSLRRLGYETTHPETGVATVRRWGLELHNLAFRLLHLVRLNTLDAFRIRFLGMEPFGDR